MAITSTAKLLASTSIYAAKKSFKGEKLLIFSYSMSVKGNEVNGQKHQFHISSVLVSHLPHHPDMYYYKVKLLLTNTQNLSVADLGCHGHPEAASG